jgi:hypothetical protein
MAGLRRVDKVCEYRKYPTNLAHSLSAVAKKRLEASVSDLRQPLLRHQVNYLNLPRMWSRISLSDPNSAVRVSRVLALDEAMLDFPVPLGISL